MIVFDSLMPATKLRKRYDFEADDYIYYHIYTIIYISC